MAGPLCRFCGRMGCRCGAPVPSRLCPRHGATMKIVSVATWSKAGWKWFEYAMCMDCGFARSLKHGQGGPRNANRKTGAKRKDHNGQENGQEVPSPLRRNGATYFRNKMGVLCEKFGAQVRVVVCPTAKQKTRGLPLRLNAIYRLPREGNKHPRKATRPR